LAGLAMATLSACGQIDDDLSDCSPAEEIQLDYEMKLITNMTTELQTQLNAVTEIEVTDALKDHLSGVFREFAHDVDLSFYDNEPDFVRLHHESHIMNDNSSTYTLMLPMRDYMHVALANVNQNPNVGITNADRYRAIALSQLEADTIDSHETSLFTARQEMHVLGNVSHTFNVRLFMANCATALVIDTTEVDFSSARAYATGLATGFLVADSTYIYPDHLPFVRAKQLELSKESGKVAYSVVGFPSRNPEGWWFKETEEVATRAEGEIIAEGTGDEGEVLWSMVIVVTLKNGNRTITYLTFRIPLLAGELKIVKAKMSPKGEVLPHDVTVGMSVTLDWNEGLDFETEL